MRLLIVTVVVMTQLVGAALAEAPLVPPKDARYTIWCTSIMTPDHVIRAKQLKETLAASTKMNDWYVIHGERDSTLYYGFYPDLTERAKSDREKIDAMRDTAGGRPFKHCMIVAVETPDPDAPPGWNLENANGYWSLQIAVFTDTPDRKQRAVEAVREARKQGIEAYYYHGPTSSSVCVGAWPQEAVKRQESSDARAPDPNKKLLVLPTELSAFVDRAPDDVQAVAPKFEPLDPAMIEAMQRFPNHAVNGYDTPHPVRDPKTGKITEIYDPSYIVLIPEKKPSMLDEPLPAPDPALEAVLREQAQDKPAPGTGRLKSIGQ